MWGILVVPLALRWGKWARDFEVPIALVKRAVGLNLDGFLLGKLLVIIQIPCAVFPNDSILVGYVPLRSVDAKVRSGRLRLPAEFRHFLSIVLGCRV